MSVTDKIIQYRDISVILLVFGILFLVAAVLFFMHFRLHRLIDRWTGGEKREKFRLVKRRNKKEKAHGKAVPSVGDSETDLLREDPETDVLPEREEEVALGDFAETGILKKRQLEGADYARDGFKVVREILLSEGGRE